MSHRFGDLAYDVVLEILSDVLAVDRLVPMNHLLQSVAKLRVRKLRVFHLSSS